MSYLYTPFYLHNPLFEVQRNVMFGGDGDWQHLFLFCAVGGTVLASPFFLFFFSSLPQLQR